MRHISHNVEEVINPDSFPGIGHFRWFNTYEQPNYGITAEMDLSKFYFYVKNHRLPMYIALIYVINAALNKVKEFRLRYDGEHIVSYDHVDPAFTIMGDNGVFANVDNVDVTGDFATFSKIATEEINKAKKGIFDNWDAADDRLDQIYYTSIPWIHFTSLTHPMKNNAFAYIPRIAWDKFKIEGEKVTFNFNIVVHHALIDGYPLSQAFIAVQTALNQPEEYLG